MYCPTIAGLLGGCSFVDRLGTRKAATFGTIAQAILTIALVLSRSIVIVSILAFNLMLARLALVRTVSRRTKLLGANTAIEILAGAGLFLGPSIGAILVLVTQKSVMPPL